MTGLTPEAIRKGFQRARERRHPWESLWRECYAFAQPQRGFGLGAEFANARRYTETLFDGTAPDAVEQLAASLLAELTPAWSQWFGFRPGHDVLPADRPQLAVRLEEMAARVRGHFERSNFAVEIHQCFLDLATVGTATLLFQEAPIGEPSAFRFAAVPAAEMHVDGDQNGAIRHHYRASHLTLATLRGRYPDAELPAWLLEDGNSNPERRFAVVEAVQPHGTGHAFAALLLHEAGDGTRDSILAAGEFEGSPFLTFRWVKGAGELYGRSPVMTALPDIKTAKLDVIASRSLLSVPRRSQVVHFAVS